MISKKFEKKINNSMYRITQYNNSTSKFKKLTNVLFKQQAKLRETYFEIKKLSDNCKFKNSLYHTANKRIRFLENMIKLYQVLLIVLIINLLVVVLFV